MATRTWDSSYESSPAGTDPKSQGDDRIRDLKLDIRERMNVGGHVWKDSTNTLDGRHAVNAGGSGVNPHIYKSDKTTPLVEFYEAAVEIAANLEVTGDVTIVGGDLYLDTGVITLGSASALDFGGSLRHTKQYAWGSPRTIVTNYTCTSDDMFIDADTRTGPIVLTLQPLSSPLVGVTPRYYVVTKRDAANSLSITGPSFCHLGNGPMGIYTSPPLTPFVIPAGCVGTVTILYESAIALALVHASLTMATRTIAASTTLNWYDNIVWLDTASADVYVTLPTISSNLSVWHPITVIKRVAGHIGAVLPQAAQSIDGGSAGSGITLSLVSGGIGGVSLIPHTTTDWSVVSTKVIP